MKIAVMTLAVIASVMCTSAEAALTRVTYQTPVPDPHGGLLVNPPVDLNFNESRTVRWTTETSGKQFILGQNFKLASNMIMDKYAVMLRADPAVDDQVVQVPGNPGPDGTILVSLWELPNLNGGNFGYPGASAGGVPIATWPLAVGEEIDSNNNPGGGPGAHAGDWLIFDTPDIALTAGTQYGIQLAWESEGVAGRKILIWVSNAPGSAYYPGDYPLGEMAIATEGPSNTSATVSYFRTYRSENFAIIGIPEPATLGLLSFGSLCCILSRRRRFQ
jgi:hypothetical protein